MVSIALSRIANFDIRLHQRSEGRDLDGLVVPPAAVTLPVAERDGSPPDHIRHLEVHLTPVMVQSNLRMVGDVLAVGATTLVVVQRKRAHQGHRGEGLLGQQRTAVHHDK